MAIKGITKRSRALEQTFCMLPVSTTLILMASSSFATASNCIDDTAGTDVPPNWQLCDFGTLQGGGDSLALSVAPGGQFFVGWAENGNNDRQPVYWSSDGTIQTLALPDGATTGQALDVAADGVTIVGTSLTTGDALVWRSGALTNLGPGSADAVSANGTVIVGQSEGQAFRWDNGTGTGLGYLDEDTESRALRVNADGSVVVGESGFTGVLNGSFVNTKTAFRWVEGQGMQSLGKISGGTFTLATGVSDDGAVVAGYGNNDTADVSFRWTEQGGLVDIGSFYEKSPGTYAYDMNADGTVIVGETYDTDWGNGRAFRWVLGERMESLGTLSGGTYSAAFGVSADGETVVGWGDNADGDYRAFIWRGTMQDYTNLMASFPDLAEGTERAVGAQQAVVGRLLDAGRLAKGQGQRVISVFGDAIHIGSDDDLGGSTGVLGGLSYGYGVMDRLTLGFSVTANRTELSGSDVNLENGFGTAVWGEYSENGAIRSGLQGSFGLGYLGHQANLTRGAGFDDVEAATGGADLTTRGGRLEFGYGFERSGGWLVTPKFGLARHISTRDAYAEDPDATAFSAAYDRLAVSATIGTLGVTGDWQLSENRTVLLAAGADFDVETGMVALVGTSNIPGMEAFSADHQLTRNAVRPNVTAALRVGFMHQGTVTASVFSSRATYGDKPEMGVGVRYDLDF